MRKEFLLITSLLLSIIVQVEGQITQCHYSCDTCFGIQYYQCLTCSENRGVIQTQQPISGMCYCSGQTDELETGICSDSNEFNYNNKAVIAAMIGLALLLGVCTMLISGMRYFFIKTIEDVQQISIIVLINLYFPQQFDIFLTQLYRFNMSSYTLQSLTAGNLFNINTNNEYISSTDGQNIVGKYKLLYKTGNFFSNQFTWILAFVCLLILGIVVHFVRNWLRSREEANKQNMEVGQQSQVDQEINNNPYNLQEITQENLQPHQNVENVQQQNQPKNIKNFYETEPNQPKGSLLYRIFNRLNNILWLNFYITFFYFSLIEINLNIFTQIANLIFSSSFAAAGAYFSALFLAAQIVLLSLLFLKTKEQCALPEWMRDVTYIAPLYLIRTTYKTLSKYFWFFACIKKILFSLFLTVYYDSPTDAIIAVSALQAIYIVFTMYLQPQERRYLRIHFYFMEAFKLLLYIGLINFTQKYVEYVRMIELTKIMYAVLVFIFTFNLFYIICCIVIERKVYYRYLRKLFCPSDKENQYVRSKIGYHSEGKLYIYYRQ